MNNDDVYILRMDPDTAKVLAEPERITRNIAPEYSASVSHDGKIVGYVAWMGQEHVILRRDMDSHTEARISSIPVSPLIGSAAAIGATVSPDGKRFAWTVPVAQPKWESYMAGMDGAPVAIPAEGPSTRDGFQCLWAQRVQPDGKGLEGAPFAVKHFHSARISPANVAGGRRRIDVARDKIVTTMAERTGNIWKAEIADSKQ